MYKIGVLIITFINVASICCVLLIPDRANVTKINDKYVDWARLYVTRVSRKSPYFINFEIKLKHTWGNNVTASYIFYEYLHNEYRRTFVEFHGGVCFFYTNEHLNYVGAMLQKAGMPCPIPAGEYHLFNLTVPMADFPYRLPFDKCRIEAIWTLPDSKEILTIAFLNVHFKNK